MEPIIIDKIAEELIQYHPLLTINLPHTDARFLDEELLLFGNASRNFLVEFLYSIKEQDFLPMGQFCHIFIPNYVYVPPEVLHEYGLDMDYRSVKFSVLWTHLYQARTLACHTATETMDLRDVLSQLHHDLPWIQLLRSSNVPKTFPFDDLDVLHNF
jgi:hypothetical protein